MTGMQEFAILVEREGRIPEWMKIEANGGSSTISAFNDPRSVANMTYTKAELPAALVKIRADHPGAYVAAHEVGHIDLKAMAVRWGEQFAKWKASGFQQGEGTP